MDRKTPQKISDLAIELEDRIRKTRWEVHVRYETAARRRILTFRSVHEQASALFLRLPKVELSWRDDAHPPDHAQFILHLFLPLDRQDDVVGDLSQRYAKRLEQYGPRKARLWYWTQTITLVAGALRERCGGLVKWGAGLEILRRWLGP